MGHAVGYLPYYMQYIDMGILKHEIRDAAKDAGFWCEKRIELLCPGVPVVLLDERGEI